MGKLPEGHDPNVVGVCSECRSEMSARYMYNSGFGESPPCKVCGGVVVVTHRKNKENALDSIDKSRGIHKNDE